MHGVFLPISEFTLKNANVWQNRNYLKLISTDILSSSTSLFVCLFGGVLLVWFLCVFGLVFFLAEKRLWISTYHLEQKWRNASSPGKH